MKKLYLAGFALALSFASNAHAVDSSGCGLGSTAFKGQTGIAPQVLAVTTNGTFSQTIAITVGTSGCDPNGTVTGGTGKMALSFIENNMEQFAIDASSGNGETIETLAGILNVDSKVLGEKVQQNFVYLFSSENVDAAELTLRLMKIAA